MTSRKHRGGSAGSAEPETSEYDAPAPPDEAEASPEVYADPFERLAAFGLERASAIFVIAYTRKSRGVAADIVAVAAELRSHPWVWAAVMATDYIRFARALGLCGLPAITVPELQHAVQGLHEALRTVPSSPSPTPDAAPAVG